MWARQAGDGFAGAMLALAWLKVLQSCGLWAQQARLQFFRSFILVPACADQRMLYACAPARCRFVAQTLDTCLSACHRHAAPAARRITTRPAGTIQTGAGAGTATTGMYHSRVSAKFGCLWAQPWSRATHCRSTRLHFARTQMQRASASVSGCRQALLAIRNGDRYDYCNGDYLYPSSSSTTWCACCP